MGQKVTYTRAERLEQINTLQEGGFNHRQIAHQLGISISQVRAVRNDPDGNKTRNRRERYQGVCENCGGKTDGSGGYHKAPLRCAACHHQKQHEERYWTEERIIAAIQQFAAEHGRRPLASEWQHVGQQKGTYPNTGTVLHVFGSWADGIEAAGYERPIQSQYFVGDSHRRLGYRIPTDTYIARIRDNAENGVAPAAQDPRLKNTYNCLFRRGIKWREACELAGVTPRMKRGWEKRLGVENG